MGGTKCVCTLGTGPDDVRAQITVPTSDPATTLESLAAAIDQFFDSDEAPWNYMMAVALVYSLPPIAIYFALRRFLSFDRVWG